MQILQLLKHDLKEQRDKMAAYYRALRKQDPAKARFLYRRMHRAMIVTENALQANLYD
jgi:hypothetical protein